MEILQVNYLMSEICFKIILCSYVKISHTLITVEA